MWAPQKTRSLRLRLRLRLGLAAALSGILLALVPAAASAATYYVSPSGSDSNPGLAASSAWQSLDKVNATPLGAGDQVLFEGGQRFTGELDPNGSGTPGQPAVYASYGTGKAIIAGLVYTSAQHDVTLRNLVVDRGVHTPGGGDCIASAYSTSGVINLVIDSVELRNCDRGILSSQHRDATWTIQSSYVHDTVDSGMILWGSGNIVKDNSILHTGQAQESFDAHGIYSKGPGVKILHNDIGYFQTDGISSRFRNALIEGNTIHDGTRVRCCSMGIAYYNYDVTETVGDGTSTISNNRIWGVPYGVNISGEGNDGAAAGPENWVIVDNTITGSRASDGSLGALISYAAATTGSQLVIQRNVFRGQSDHQLYLGRTPGSYIEDHNDWGATGDGAGRGSGDVAGAQTGYGPGQTSSSKNPSRFGAIRVHAARSRAYSAHRAKHRHHRRKHHRRGR